MGGPNEAAMASCSGAMGELDDVLVREGPSGRLIREGPSSPVPRLIASLGLTLR